MAYENLTENPEETVLILTLLGLILGQGLNAIGTGILGRFFFYIGEVLLTLSILLAAKEEEEKKMTAAAKEDMAQMDGDNIKIIISELQQQNQYLQHQVWMLQEALADMQNR